MVIKCPFCSYPYQVDADGKYQCGVCGSKYYLISGQIVFSEGAGRYGSGGLIVGRYRVIGELYPETPEVFYSCIDERSGNLVCLKDLRPEEGYVPVDLDRFVPIGEIVLSAGGKLPENNVGSAVLFEPEVQISPAPAAEVPPAPAPVPEESDKGAEDAGAEKKKGKKVWKIILLAVILLILGGGSFFAWHKGYWGPGWREVKNFTVKTVDSIFGPEEQAPAPENNDESGKGK